MFYEVHSKKVPFDIYKSISSMCQVVFMGTKNDIARESVTVLK